MQLRRIGEMWREEIIQGVLKYYAETCRARGIQMPTDIDLINRAQEHVVFFDAEGRELSLDSVAISWEEGV